MRFPDALHRTRASRSDRPRRLGVKTQIEVQDAELNLRTAEGNLARARRDYRVALVNLDWVRGGL